MEYIENGKKLGVLGFLAGFLFNLPIVSAIGAGLWGAIELYQLFTKKK